MHIVERRKNADSQLRRVFGLCSRVLKRGGGGDIVCVHIML
jgi:hypothetical protein